MQPNTVNNPYNTHPPVPTELLEAVARALAAALIPAPRRPPPPETETEEPADFLTAAQLARRSGSPPVPPFPVPAAGAVVAAG